MSESRSLPPRSPRRPRTGGRPLLSSTLALRCNPTGRGTSAPASRGTARPGKARGQLRRIAAAEEEPLKETEATGADMITGEGPVAVNPGDDEAARGDIARPLPERAQVGLCNTSESAAASRLDFATPAPALAPLELESFEPQQTTSTIGGQAVAAAKMRGRCQELQLETVRLERVKLEIELVNKQLQLKESNGSNLSKGQSAAGRSRKVITPIIASTINLLRVHDHVLQV